MARLPDPTRWNASDAEAAERQPCDDLLDGELLALTRAIDIDAPVSTVYRWLCQLRVAPYSYDLLDNLGRRSPTELTPGLDDLRVGQRFLVFRIASCARDVHLTGRGTRAAELVFGPLAVSYVVRARPSGTRLLVRLLVGARPPRLGRLRRRVLTWGDLVMMRKQLLVLKRRAESSTPGAAAV